MKRAATIALVFLLSDFASAAPSLVVLVRHAERAAAPADDPPLTAAGKARAQELARLVEVLSSAIPLKAIFTDESLRTKQTAAPLESSSGIHATVIPGNAESELAARVLAIPRGTVLIVGHRDTVPKLIHDLGGPAGIVISESEFNHFFSLAAPGTARAKLASNLYGK